MSAQHGGVRHADGTSLAMATILSRIRETVSVVGYEE
jgi:hypothetical protein